MEVREGEFLLSRAGESVPVEPKAFRVLLFLLQNPGRLVKKDEIMSAVWDDCTVSDNSHTRSIATLRRLLGDDAREPRYIATVQTIGYRFLCPVKVSDGPVDQPDAAPSLTEGEQQQSIPDGRRAKWVLVAVMATAVLVPVVWIVEHSVKYHDGTARLISGGKYSPPTPVRVVQITNLSGNVSWPAFSPDGRQIAFVWARGETDLA